MIAFYFIFMYVLIKFDVVMSKKKKKNFKRYDLLKQTIHLKFLKDCLPHFFFYLGFLSRTFMIHRTAGEGGGYLFNSFLPLPSASQTFQN